MNELTIVVVLTVRQGTEQELRGVLSSLVPPSRRDHGNLQYEAYVDQADPRRFVFVERWVDEAAQVKHDGESDHIRQFKKDHGHKIEKADVYRLQSIA